MTPNIDQIINNNLEINNQDIETLKTIRDYIRWGTSRFNEAKLYFGHGTDNALDEAITLVLHALHLPPDLPPAYLDARLTQAERQAVLSLLSQRIKQRQPAAYLTQQAWFAGIEWYVDARVLVPRSPLAELIENGFQPWLDMQKVYKVLDLGTGSGCIGIATALHFPTVTVDLTDISTDAIAVANRHITEFELEDRVQVIKSDIFADLGNKRYDLILSNPPYVASAELMALPTEYQREPAIGLDGGMDGLDIVRRILQQARQHLEPNGTLIVEVGNSAEALERAYPNVAFTWLAFERGGDGVFLLTAEQVDAWAETFEVN